MAQPADKPTGDELKVEGMTLFLEPSGIVLDASGRITFKDPKILQAILGASNPLDRKAAEDTNYCGCNSNCFQCGKVATTLP